MDNVWIVLDLSWLPYAILCSIQGTKIIEFHEWETYRLRQILKLFFKSKNTDNNKLSFTTHDEYIFLNRTSVEAIDWLIVVILLDRCLFCFIYETHSFPYQIHREIFWSKCESCHWTKKTSNNCKTMQCKWKIRSYRLNLFERYILWAVQLHSILFLFFIESARR